MDYRYPDDATAFRLEVRQWLETNLEDSLRGFASRGSMSPEQLEALRAWNRKLADAGYAAISWPQEYGGRGAGVMEQVVLAEEMHRDDAGRLVGDGGLDRLGEHTERVGIDVDENRLRSETRHAPGGREEGEVGNDDLIARADAERHQGNLQGVRAVGDRNDVRAVQIL